MFIQLAKAAARRHLWKRSSASLLQLFPGSQSITMLLQAQCLQRPRAFSSDQDASEHLSSDGDTSEFLCSNKARIFVENLGVRTKDFEHNYGSSEKLNSMIESAKEAAKIDFKLDKLKQLYKRVRPEFVSRLLIHNHPFDDPCTHWLRYQTHARIEKPRFTSCYDLMFD
uniref:Uncharacterized protein n=1 Tax=Arundo donax TaxID=35708 RepID=A0A0A9T0A5_ARUDO